LNYPVWQLGFPGGILIAVVAILHVFVSHFAVGGGAFLVVTEQRAHQRGDRELLAYVRRHSNFFALLTLVFGAISGVGIWFTIGLVSPEGTSTLIHSFVWGWAIEWVFFFVEIAAAIIYAKSWDTLDPRSHRIIGWIYFVAAYMSLVIINGIITFMLTPGKWIQTHGFWDGFWNATYWPSLVARTAMCLLLAGVWGLVTVGKSAARERIVRWSGEWILAGAVILPLALWWYLAKVPAASKTMMASSMTGVVHAIRGGIGFGVAVALLALIFAIAKPRWMRTPVIAVMIVCALGFMGAAEYMREFVRKPWVVTNYIYSNDLRADSIDAISKDGVRKNANFLLSDSNQSQQYGRDLFVLECSSCHGANGYRSMKSRVVGWDADFAADMLSHIHMLKGAMPNFAGNDEDRAALGNYLASLNPPINYGPITATNKLQVGEQVFAVRCGHCHTVNGKFRPLRGVFENAQPDQVSAMFPVLDSMSPNMPKFTAPDDQAQALAEYISHEANRPLTATEKPEARLPGVK